MLCVRALWDILLYSLHSRYSGRSAFTTSYRKQNDSYDEAVVARQVDERLEHPRCSILLFHLPPMLVIASFNCLSAQR